MKKLLSKKSTLFSLALLFGASASYAASCTINCDSYARMMRNHFCAQIGGGSACDTSPAIYDLYYRECQQNYCSN